MESNEVNFSRKSFLAIAAIATLTFIGVLTETSMNVTFPALMKTYDVDMNTVQWVTTGYLLTVALIMITSAFLKRRFKNSQLFIAAAWLYIIGDLMCIFAPNFWLLLLGRIIQSGCVGISGPLMTNIMLEVVPRKKLGVYLGTGSLIILIAPAIGPSFGGLMVYLSDWRLIFWSTLPIALIALVLGKKVIEQYSAVNSEIEFDWTRFAVLAVGIVSLILGLNLATGPNGVIKFAILFAVSIVLFIVFYYLSKNSTKALFNLNIFKDSIFTLSFFPYVFLQMSNIGINFLLPNYAQLVNHSSSLIGGLILLPGSLLNGFGQPFYGYLLDRFGGKLPLYLGNALVAISMLVMMLLGVKMSIVTIVILYLIFSIGRSMAFGNTMTYGLKIMDSHLRNDANAIYNTGQQLAGSIGTTVMAALMTGIHLPTNTSVENIGLGSQVAFGLVLVLTLVNFVVYARLFKVPSEV
ncbi:MFS transporter [Lentilactobacillus sp. SPB1-3]|uniref:MFS transporter n=1 Tax=Lentilactobacillus terminaliae TaxID=3003483 RepID=A0ACD5DFC7_9LACO|nr:MFS transporter [Lentilactobacillus sp. SPB1-3]MCZ0976376.1 MFS transporter [Lentilactobacillus sp. SPB1-3]